MSPISVFSFNHCQGEMIFHHFCGPMDSFNNCLPFVIVTTLFYLKQDGYTFVLVYYERKKNQTVPDSLSVK